MISLHRLEGFYWVARAQGYARAARAFPYPITQPGVHQQVRKLEADVGVRLFERVGKDRVLLTPPGQALYNFVAPFFEQLPAVIQSISEGPLGGTLRIHAPGQILRQLLPPWLRRLQRKRPDIVIDLQESGSADINLLRRGETDLLVDHLPTIPVDVVTQKVGMVYAFIVVPADHRLAQRKHFDLRDLREETFIAYHPDRRHRLLQMQALQLHGISPPRVLSADTSDTILSFVSAGLGYSIVPTPSASGPRQRNVVAQRLTHPGASFPIYAAWRNSEVKNPLIEAALQWAPKAKELSNDKEKEKDEDDDEET